MKREPKELGKDKHGNPIFEDDSCYICGTRAGWVCDKCKRWACATNNHMMFKYGKSLCVNCI